MQHEIEFLPGEDYNSTSEVVEFFAKVDGEKVRCTISMEALLGHFGPTGVTPQELLETFRKNRSGIEGRAVELINRGRVQGKQLVIFSDDL